MVLGHEGAAVVESIGDGVEGIEIGDKIIPLLVANCEKFKFCLNKKIRICIEGDYNQILFDSDSETRMKINGKPLLSFC